MLELLDTEYNITSFKIFKEINMRTQNTSKEHYNLKMNKKIFKRSKLNF